MQCLETAKWIEVEKFVYTAEVNLPVLAKLAKRIAPFVAQGFTCYKHEVGGSTKQDAVKSVGANHRGMCYVFPPCDVKGGELDSVDRVEVPHTDWKIVLVPLEAKHDVLVVTGGTRICFMAPVYGSGPMEFTILDVKTRGKKYTLDPKSWVLQLTSLPDEIQMNDTEREELWNQHPEDRGQIMRAGNVMQVSRWFQSYGMDYKFSGMNHIAKPIEHPFLKRIKKWVEAREKKEYKEILVNWYRGGTDWIDFHRDDEKAIVSGTTIYCFTYCDPNGERDFVIKDKDGAVALSLRTPNNSLIAMGGDANKNYKHGVPVRKKQTGRRISITVRCFK